MTNATAQNQSIETVTTSIANAIEASQNLDAKVAKALRSLLRQASAEARRVSKASKKAPAKKAAPKAAAKKAAPKAAAKKAAPAKKAGAVKTVKKAAPKTATKKAAPKAVARTASKVSAPKVDSKPVIAQVRRSKKPMIANGLAH